MSEPNYNYSKKLVEIFLKEYNNKNNTSFEWIDGKSYQPKDKPYFDFLVFDGKNELGIQHTRAVADPIREYIKPKAADQVVEPLRKMLEDNPIVGSLSIYLNFFNPPSNKDETEELIYWLEYFITSKLTPVLGVGYFKYEASFDDQFLPRLLKHIDDIDFKPHPNGNTPKIIEITYGWSKKEPEPWLDDAQRVIKAIDRKAAQSEDILLLVESGWSGIHDLYLQTIKDNLSEKALKEVWIVEPYLSGEKAYQVK